MTRKAAATLFFYWLPPVAYMCVIFALSSTPAAGKLPLVWKHQDKIIHFAEYFFLAFLAARAVAGPTSTPGPWSVILGGAAAAAFGVLDEVHQGFVPGRDADFGDVVADAYGVVAGLLAYCSLVRSRAAGERRRHDELNGVPGSGGY